MKRILVLASFIVSLNASAESYLKIIYIADSTVECNNGEECLQIRDAPTTNWSVYNGLIDGFTYENGFEYCLLVDVLSNKTNGPTDDSIVELYKLKEVKYKKATSSKTNDTLSAASTSTIPDSSKWILYKLKRKEGTKTFSISKAYIQFDMVNNKMEAYADCNTIQAAIFSDNMQLKIENISVSSLTCGKKSIETDFINTLKAVTHYKIKSKLLYLYNNSSLLALFTLKKE